MTRTHILSTGSCDQGREDEAVSTTTSRFWEVSWLRERIHTLDLWEERMEDLRREMTTIKEALKGKAPTTVDELVQRTDHPFTPEVMA